jgi:hypothetical protein
MMRDIEVCVNFLHLSRGQAILEACLAALDNEISNYYSGSGQEKNTTNIYIEQHDSDELMELFTLTSIIFGVLTFMHPIADFGTPRRRWKGEFWLTLNPLHALWDISPFRQHHKYSKIQSGMQVINPAKFWKWLAVDQTAHVILNAIWAFCVAFVILFL